MKKIIINSILSLMTIFVFILGKQIYIYQSIPTLNSDKNKIDAYAKIVYLHIPFSPLEKKAIQNILKIAKKDKALELYAYEMLRSSIYGIRHFSTPYKKELAFLEDKIAHIRAQKLLADGYKKSYKETYAEMKKVMTTDLAPNPLLALSSILFFLGFVASTIIAIIKSSQKDKFDFKLFSKYLPLILATWILWIITLYKA
ncbi:DUF3627 domain-containing protein [Desulfonauticus submarinus]